MRAPLAHPHRGEEHHRGERPQLVQEARERGEAAHLPVRPAEEAHQLLHENKHLGKISILVGATSEDEGKQEEGPGAIRAEVGA